MSEVGLGQAERDEIGAQLTACLAGINRDTARDLAQGGDRRAAAAHLGKPLSALAAHVARNHGWSGLFELACCSMDVILHGLSREEGSPLRFMGWVPDGGEAVDPDDPSGKVIREFGTALQAVDRFSARLIFDGLQPDQGRDALPAPELQRFLFTVMHYAWQRQDGGRLQVTLGPGTRWPPVCDFCCGTDAKWLFHADQGTATAVLVSTRSEGKYATLAEMVMAALGHIPTEPADGGAMVIKDDDFEHWYACGRCRTLVEKRPVPWRDVYARLIAARGPRTTAPWPLVRQKWESFQACRRQRRAVPLPAERPPPRKQSGLAGE